jgi:Holliday junction DNA helicase RuvB
MNPTRPISLNEFIGQPAVRKIISVLIAAAKKRSEPVPHMLLSGPPGLGKTTLARLIASEMGGRLVEMIGSAVKTPHDMTQHLVQLKAHDVLFVDEVHAIPRRIEETLYPAMEDGVITTSEKGFDDLVKQLGIGHSQQSTRTHRLPPFTLVGATTLQGLVSAPLRSRFRQILELQPYAVADLQRIVNGAATKLAFSLPEELATEIAQRSRGTARIAISHLLWFRDCVEGDGGVATPELLRLAFEMKGVDAQGLTTVDREYLRRLVESEEAVGLDTLASVLGESIATITETIEPFLLRNNFVSRTPRGRMATEKAKQILQEIAA